MGRALELNQNFAVPIYFSCESASVQSQGRAK